MHNAVKLFVLSLILSIGCMAQSGSTLAGPTNFAGKVTISSPSTVVLGEQSGSATTTVGANSVIMVPILTPTGASGYTLANFNFKVSTSAGNAIVGLYSQGSSSCPSNASACGATLLCSNTSTATTSGINTITSGSLTGCPTLTASTYYYLALIASSGTLALNEMAASYCPGTGYNDLKASPGSFALPSTLGTQTQGNFCPQMWVTLNCVSSCGLVQPPWAAITFTGNTATAVVTAASLRTGSSCLNGSISATIANATYQTTQLQGFTNAPISCGSPVSSGSLSILRDSAKTDEWTYQVTNQSSNTFNSSWWWYNSGNTMSSGDSCDIGEIGGGNTWTFHLVGASGPSVTLQVERSGGTTTSIGKVSFSQNTWYFLALLSVGGGVSQAAVFNTSGVQVPTSTFTTSPAGQGYVCPDGKTICMISDKTNPPADIKFLNEGSCASDSGTMYYGPVLFDPTGSSFPTVGAAYGQIFFPDSEKVIGKELADKVESGEIPRAHLTEKGWYSYALHRYVS
jgi:hypothetical protein